MRSGAVERGSAASTAAALAPAPRVSAASDGGVSVSAGSLCRRWHDGDRGDDLGGFRGRSSNLRHRGGRGRELTRPPAPWRHRSERSQRKRPSRATPIRWLELPDPSRRACPRQRWFLPVWLRARRPGQVPPRQPWLPQAWPLPSSLPRELACLTQRGPREFRPWRGRARAAALWLVPINCAGSGEAAIGCRLGRGLALGLRLGSFRGLLLGLRVIGDDTILGGHDGVIRARLCRRRKGVDGMAARVLDRRRVARRWLLRGLGRGMVRIVLARRRAADRRRNVGGDAAHIGSRKHHQERACCRPRRRDGIARLALGFGLLLHHGRGGGGQRIEQIGVLDWLGRHGSARHNHMLADGCDAEQPGREGEGQADAAMRGRIARHDAAMQRGARPGQTLHPRHRRAAIEVRVVAAALFQDRKHAGLGRIAAHAGRHARARDTRRAAINVDFLLGKRDDERHRLAVGRIGKRCLERLGASGFLPGLGWRGRNSHDQGRHSEPRC